MRVDVAPFDDVRVRCGAAAGIAGRDEMLNQVLSTRCPRRPYACMTPVPGPARAGPERLATCCRRPAGRTFARQLVTSRSRPVRSRPRRCSPPRRVRSASRSARAGRHLDLPPTSTCSGVRAELLEHSATTSRRRRRLDAGLAVQRECTGGRRVLRRRPPGLPELDPAVIRLVRQAQQIEFDRAATSSGAS
ncbi:hypothetical protein HBB16_11655 [Pseudonocardia sp. MCCB 268]|nr:hypothetical protein [Pseudonocardia cytotoxica]